MPRTLRRRDNREAQRELKRRWACAVMAGTVDQGTVEHDSLVSWRVAMLHAKVVWLIVCSRPGKQEHITIATLRDGVQVQVALNTTYVGRLYWHHVPERKLKKFSVAWDLAEYVNRNIQSPAEFLEVVERTTELACSARESKPQREKEFWGA